MSKEVDKPRMFYCSCGCSAFAVSHDEQDGEIYISPWTTIGYDLGWRGKLRIIRHILKFGHPYTDFVIHSPNEVRVLVSYLLQLADSLQSAYERQYK